MKAKIRGRPAQKSILAAINLDPDEKRVRRGAHGMMIAFGVAPVEFIDPNLAEETLMLVAGTKTTARGSCPKEIQFANYA